MTANRLNTGAQSVLLLGRLLGTLRRWALRDGDSQRVNEVLDILQHAGPAELIHRIRHAEASDPHGERWPRYKTGDDATAARCLF